MNELSGTNIRSKISLLSEFLLFFLASSLVGWIYEEVLTFVVFHEYEDRGILHLPLCPIYGFGMLLLFLCLRKVKNGFLILVYSSVITTILELVASYILEYKFDMELWSYNDWPFNYQGRISLFSSLIFGVMAVFAFKIMFPLIDKLYRKNAHLAELITAVIVVVAVVIQIVGMANADAWMM